MEDLEAVDYTKYFSTVKKRGANTGAEQKQFSEFSARAVRAVKVGQGLQRRKHAVVNTVLALLAPLYLPPTMPFVTQKAYGDSWQHCDTVLSALLVTMLRQDGYIDDLHDDGSLHKHQSMLLTET